MVTPSQRIRRTIIRGSYWSGLTLTCKKSDQSPSDLSTCTPIMKMRNTKTGEYVTLTVTKSSNTFIVQPLNEAATAALSAGTWSCDLFITWTGKTIGTYFEAEFTVINKVSVP